WKITGRHYLVYVHGEELRVASVSRELAWMTRRVLAGASTIVANSHNTASLLRAEWKVPLGRTRVLHPGVDVNRFCPAERNDAVRQALGWSGRLVILTVGRLQRRKGHDILLRALPAIRRQIPNVLYSIVGDGIERQQLEQLVNELGIAECVQLRGEPDD